MIKSIKDLNMYTHGLYAEPLTDEYQLYLTVTGGFTTSKYEKKSIVPDTLIEFNRAYSVSDIELNTIHRVLYNKFTVNIRPKELTTKSIYEELEKCGFIKTMSEELQASIRCRDNTANAKKHIVLYFFDISESYDDCIQYKTKIMNAVEKYGMPERGYKMMLLEGILDKRKHLIKVLIALSKAENVLIILPSDNYIGDKISEKMLENYDLLTSLLDVFDHVHCEVLTVEPD
jgi:hypothetical protein